MKTRKNKKSGFTLVELMVVAIIVAILAAVAIPLMTGNKERAIATEGQAGLSTISTQLRMVLAEDGDFANVTDVASLPGIRTGDLEGTYFADGDYGVSAMSVTAGTPNYTISASPSKSTDTVTAAKTVTMTVALGEATWSGDLIGK
jgi:type IV pilus assembly protein PilA